MLSPSSIASCLWPRRTLVLGWLRLDEPWVRVVDPLFLPRHTIPVQLSWGPLSTLAAKRVHKHPSQFKSRRSVLVSYLEFQELLLFITKQNGVRQNQRCDCWYLPVSLCPPDSRLQSALLLPWVLCPCFGMELEGETSLSLEPVPERVFLPGAFCLSRATSPASLELSTP